ncbi:MAG: hypothetical protein GXY64_03005 [Bacteroidales bacterium]|nr:hypothetical protein [Bacteroidales bacterium]
MEEKTQIIFNISGGNNQILPNATKAEQHFYGDELARKMLKGYPSCSSSTEEHPLALYINNVENLKGYLAQLATCTSATELAMIVIKMVEQEPKVTKEDAVKERFISLLLTHAPKLEKGTSVSNVRARINDALAKYKPLKK